MLDEDGERHGFFLQYAECERNDCVAVTLRKVGDCANEASARAAEFIASLADGILADDRASVARTDLFEGAQGCQSADFVDSADERFGGRARASDIVE